MAAITYSSGDIVNLRGKCHNDILLLFVTVTNVLTYRKSVNITVILCQCMAYILSSDIYSVARAKVYPVWAAVLLLPVVNRCQNHLGAPSLNSS